MARTIYFPDGSHDVLFFNEYDDNGTDKKAEALERILRERLGRDTVELFLEIMRERKDAVELLESELRSYTLSNEQYRTCLQDTFDGLSGISTKLTLNKHLDRQTLDAALRKLLTSINNEL